MENDLEKFVVRAKKEEDKTKELLNLEWFEFGL